MKNHDSEDFALEIHDLTVAYGTKSVLWDIDLQIPTGTLTAILGPNGAGKSTLLKTILHLMKPISGEITLNSNNIAYVPQTETVDWNFPTTVLDVVLMGIYHQLKWYQKPTKQQKNQAKELLSQVGLEKYHNRQINQLSGGQKQRVFLVRALMQQAEIYFLDEPFKGVDMQTEKIIIKLLKDLKSQGKTIFVVHHDLNTVQNYFDWVTFINLQVIANGKTEDIFQEKTLESILEQTYGTTQLLRKTV